MMEGIRPLPEKIQIADIGYYMPMQGPSWFPYSVIVPIYTPFGIVPSSPSRESIRGPNPFDNPNLTLEGAAKYLFQIIEAASTASEEWLKEPRDHITSVANDFREENPFKRMCRDFSHILSFLKRGRWDWDLAYLPDNFFADVGTLMPSLLVNVECLSDVEGCDWLCNKGLIPLRDVQTELEEIQELRKEIWRRTKETYERKQQAEKVASSSEAGNGG